METVDYNLDQQLTEFITDFSDGSLEGIELEVFNEYLQTCNPIQSFAQKAKRGRESLKGSEKITAADDFEEKLALRIAQEEVSEYSSYQHETDLESVS